MPHAVLIVDDEPRIFNALRRALHRESYELLSAANAEEALAILGNRPVDVIIADENMPGMKGSALLARVRQQWPDVVRMMLTGDARLETVVAAVNRGEIFRFFIKPCNEVELLVSIRDALAGREMTPTAPIKRSDAPSHPASHSQKAAPKAGPIRLDDDEGDSPSFHDLDSPGPARKADLSMDDDPSETGAIFRLEGSEIGDNVDSLLDEIRNELEKLDS